MRPHVIVLVVAIGGRVSAQPQPRPADYQAADSIVLERGPCFGTCPVYRVSIARSGDVHFVWLRGADSGKTERRRIDPSRFASLMSTATFAHLFALPDTVIKGPFCPYTVSDAPSAKVSLFLPGRQKTIVDYLGCLWAPSILRQIETAMDEEANTRRWVR